MLCMPTPRYHAKSLRSYHGNVKLTWQCHVIALNCMLLVVHFLKIRINSNKIKCMKETYKLFTNNFGYHFFFMIYNVPLVNKIETK